MDVRAGLAGLHLPSHVHERGFLLQEKKRVVLGRPLLLVLFVVVVMVMVMMMHVTGWCVECAWLMRGRGPLSSTSVCSGAGRGRGGLFCLCVWHCVV